MRAIVVILALVVLPFKAVAQDKLVRLYAPPALVDSGLLKYALPRFSLKTQVRVEFVDPAAAEMVLGDTGRALFEGAGAVWSLEVRVDDDDTARLADWFTSDVGRNTVLAYAPDGVALFTLPKAREAVVAEVELTGDPALGLKVSLEKCTRCHAVDEKTRWSSIGSTPSFAVLRSLPDWEYRFTAFYALNPHPSFTQIEDVTEPFAHDRPSPIVPITLTLDEVEAVLAYVGGMKAADLGGALVID